jgi:hypothetical protein
MDGQHMTWRHPRRGDCDPVLSRLRALASREGAWSSGVDPLAGPPPHSAQGQARAECRGVQGRRRRWRSDGSDWGRGAPDGFALDAVVRRWDDPPDGSALVVLDATFERDTVRRYPLRLRSGGWLSRGAVAVEWGRSKCSAARRFLAASPRGP